MSPRYPYVHVDVRAQQAEDVSTELWELGAQGVEERDRTTLDRPAAEGVEVTLVASFPDEASARGAAAELGRRFATRVEHVIGDEWRDAWKKHFVPTRIGKRLVVRPSWETYRSKKGDVVLVVDPDRAFGTGTHETTRLVLRALDGIVKPRAKQTVLDVGCGSGILAIGALLLGAARARAIDVDPDAVRVTRENARRNRVTDRLRTDTTPVERVRGQFDVVLANIEARVLIPLAAAIGARARRELVLSGVLRGQEDDVRAAYGDFELIEVPSDGEWVALVLRRRA